MWSFWWITNRPGFSMWIPAKSIFACVTFDTAVNQWWYWCTYQDKFSASQQNCDTVTSESVSGCRPIRSIFHGSVMCASHEFWQQFFKCQTILLQCTTVFLFRVCIINWPYAQRICRWPHFWTHQAKYLDFCKWERWESLKLTGLSNYQI